MKNEQKELVVEKNNLEKKLKAAHKRLEELEQDKEHLRKDNEYYRKCNEDLKTLENKISVLEQEMKKVREEQKSQNEKINKAAKERDQAIQKVCGTYLGLSYYVSFKMFLFRYSWNLLYRLMGCRSVVGNKNQ